MTESSLRIGLAGLGTVGQEVARVLQLGKPGLDLVAVSARDKNRSRAFMPEGVAWEADARALAQRSDVDVVVELIGGADGVALELAEASLMAGKHLVTANKALLAGRAVELAQHAAQQGVALGFEAAVAGGIPVIKTLREALIGRKVTRISGILNGTCNFILSEMTEKGSDFATVLAEAQALGYAEADPSFDIDGIDAAQKLAILSGMAFDRVPSIHSISIEGITAIDAVDIGFARELHHTIRLIATVEARDDGLVQQVRPMLVPNHASLAHVGGVTNAVRIEADMVGELVLMGPGAGGAATASAILSDILDIQAGAIRPFFAVDTAALGTQNAPLSPSDQRWYLRMRMADQSGTMAAVTAIMAAADLSIDSVIQRGGDDGDSHLPVIFMTHEASWDVVARAIANIRGDTRGIRDIVALPVLD